ncbi:sugar phosphate isomerase/epimerase [Mucilaginibacter sp. L3T2-6]|uniref:sugar phosphate isomerase/epimerase family protein n=1 Tax=Mucilaginibacter sp. L3T2-6 TaxID=3062491 RepID=UPI002674B6AC|nr:TIM barrel protein [Mucilaginibacter sp. L3T2-6]MDO3644135.1 TIM barrel protein [Mucilaginibacter sp. L3T2-6]MDV6216584.1 TIM barrel protein [Mucilaginibacter sp. L3T2-6]
MDSSRRNFIKNSALVVAGAAIMPNALFAESKKLTRLGIQLYSVRDAMGKDPMGTLKKLSAGEVKHVEHANYINRKFYGYSAKEFKKILNDLGMLMPSGHTVMTAKDWDASKNDFTDKWKYTVEDAAEVGQRYVISPWLDESLRTDMDGLKRFMEQFNKCGELCKSHGMKFGYHNHDFEFSTRVGDSNLFDYILKNTDPELVVQQLDTGNMAGVPGGDPLELLAKYPGRFELMHVKDEIKATGNGEMGHGYESTIIGQGIMPMKEILKTARKTGGTSQFIIEQESYQGKDPVDCVIIDLQTMKKWGY